MRLRDQKITIDPKPYLLYNIFFNTVYYTMDNLVTIVEWYSKDNTFNRLKLYNKTEEEAMHMAYSFGYTPPKWWEFWKNKAIVSSYTE